MTDEDRLALGRLAVATIGKGFALVIVECTMEAERVELLAWYQALAASHDARVVDVQLADLAGENPLDELKTALGALPPRTILFLHGLEFTERRKRDPESGLARRLNVQRDALVEQLPFHWVLVVHPTLRNHMRRRAADFVDFARRWVESEDPPLQTSRRHASRVTMSDAPVLVPVVFKGDSPGEGVLADGWRAIRGGDYARAGRIVAALKGAPLPHPGDGYLALLDAWARMGSLSGDPQTALEIAKAHVDPGVATRAWLLEAARAAMRVDRDAAHTAFARARERAGNDGDLLAWVALAEARANLGEDPAHLVERFAVLAEGAASGSPLWEEATQALAEAAGLAGLPEARERALSALDNRGKLHSRAWVALTRVDDAINREADLDDARAQAERALDVFHFDDTLYILASLQEKLSTILRLGGRFESALEIVDQVIIPSHARRGDAFGLVNAFQERAQNLHRLRRFDEAISVLEGTVIARLSMGGRRRDCLFATAVLAEVVAARGGGADIVRAKHLLEVDAIPGLREIGDRTQLGYALIVLARVLLAEGEWLSAAIVIQEQALPAFLEFADRWHANVARLDLAGAWINAGYLAKSRSLLEESVIPQAERLGHVVGVAFALDSLAELMLCDNDPSGAVRLLRDRVLPLLRRLDESVHLPDILKRLARAEWAAGNGDEAIRILRDEGIPAVAVTGPVADFISCRRLLATWLWQRNHGADRKRAKDLLRSTEADAQRLGLPSVRPDASPTDVLLPPLSVALPLGWRGGIW